MNLWALFVLTLQVQRSHQLVFRRVQDLSGSTQDDVASVFTSLRSNVSFIKSKIECAGLASALISKTMEWNEPHRKCNAFSYDNLNGNCSIGFTIPFMDPGAVNQKDSTHGLYAQDHCLPEVPAFLKDDQILGYWHLIPFQVYHFWGHDFKNITATKTYYPNYWSSHLIPSPFYTVTGKFALHFGTYGAVEWKRSEPMTFNSFTFLIWFYPEDEQLNKCLFAMTNGGNPATGFGLYRAGLRKNTPATTGNGGYGNQFASQAVVRPHQWNHLAVTQDHKTGRNRIYHNGTNVIFEATGWTSYTHNNINTYTIGKRGTDYANCVVGQAVLYRRAFSAEEVARFFEQSLAFAQPQCLT